MTEEIELTNPTQFEIEEKKISLFSKGIRKPDFDLLSHPARHELVQKKIYPFDVPEIGEFRYNRLSHEERAKLDRDHVFVHKGR
jgi:hypothetical protein